jgi:carbamoyltransferase
MFILGIHFGSHDTCAALVEDGRLVAVMEQERFDHHKHTLAFPKDALAYCLEAGGLALKDLDYLAYGSDCAVANEYKRRFIDKGYSNFRPDMLEQGRIEQFIAEQIGGRPAFYHVDHHLAHAASTFFTSPYEEAAIYTVDGMGNWMTASQNIGRGHAIEIVNRTPYPHSLGMFYGAITQLLGFKASRDEGKVMGLAPYGSARLVDQVRQLCQVKDGELTLDLSYFAFHRQPLMKPDGTFHVWYSQKMAEVIGPPRMPESALTERDADLAYACQAVLEEMVYAILSHFHRRCPLDNLCLAGGVALNSTLNGKIAQHTPYKNVYVVPAANDAGVALGAALSCSSKTSRNFKRHELTHAYFGSEYTPEDLAGALQNLPPGVSVTRPNDMIAEMARLLRNNLIVGRYEGRMEFGPRALGNRSILANPAKAEIKDIVNAKVKFREGFRPFAPVATLESARDYFDMDFDSPFMLKIVQVKKDKQGLIPAVVHVDKSARVQTVSQDQNPPLHRLLDEMGKNGGVPVLLNTSFNIRGDTIVRTPEDAVRCFLKTGMDALALGPYLAVKQDEKTQVNDLREKIS